MIWGELSESCPIRSGWTFSSVPTLRSLGLRSSGRIFQNSIKPKLPTRHENFNWIVQTECLIFPHLIFPHLIPFHLFLLLLPCLFFSLASIHPSNQKSHQTPNHIFLNSFSFLLFSSLLPSSPRGSPLHPSSKFHFISLHLTSHLRKFHTWELIHYRSSLFKKTCFYVAILVFGFRLLCSELNVISLPPF